MSITQELVKEVAAFADQNNPTPATTNTLAPPVTLDAPASPEAKKEIAPVVDTKPEAIITPPTDTPPVLSDEDTAYLESLNTSTDGKEKEIQEGRKDGNEKNAQEKNEVLIPKEISDDNFIKDYLEVKKKGGDVSKFIRETFSEIKNLTDEQVMERSLRELNFSDEEVAEEMERTFGVESTLSKLQKKQLITPMREKLESAQQTKAQKYKNELPDNSTLIEAQQKRTADIANSAVKQLDSMKEQFVGKRFLGMPVTEEQWNTVSQSLKDGNGYAFPKFENGQLSGFDLEQSIEYAMFKNYKNDILKANVNIGEIKGYNKFYEQRKRPSQENTSTGTVLSEQTVDDAMKNINFRNK